MTAMQVGNVKVTVSVAPPPLVHKIVAVVLPVVNGGITVTVIRSVIEEPVSPFDIHEYDSTVPCACVQVKEWLRTDNCTVEGPLILPTQGGPVNDTDPVSFDPLVHVTSIDTCPVINGGMIVKFIVFVVEDPVNSDELQEYVDTVPFVCVHVRE